MTQVDRRGWMDSTIEGLCSGALLPLVVGRWSCLILDSDGTEVRGGMD